MCAACTGAQGSVGVSVTDTLISKRTRAFQMGQLWLPSPGFWAGVGVGGVGMQADGAPDQVGSREQGAGAAVSPALPGAGL